jgi:propanol-preferring alcohol dehydrogenase
MRAMILTSPGQPLVETQCPEPSPGAGQVLIRVQACAVCRTDLHILDGDLGPAKLPLILGHEIVGTVAAAGPDARRFKAGDRIGVPWLGSTCGACRYCLNGRENLCSSPQFTGYTIDGGFAEYTVADERFGFSLPQAWSPISASPLLCAGLIGYRSLIKTGRAKTIGIYGFGSAARIVTQVACHRGCEVYAFTRRGDSRTQEAAVRLGAVWAGSSEIAPPRLLEAAIIFAPSGDLVPRALRGLEP